MLFVCGLAGCFQSNMRTTTGQNVYFPPGSDYQNAKYWMHLRSEGAVGKAYVDYSVKEVTVYIFRGQAEESSFGQTYELTAGDLSWTVIWPVQDNLRIEFFERANPSNILKTLYFTFNTNTSQFIETNSLPRIPAAQ